jgi:membrane protein YqaA with SNARE-associated domain
MRAWVERLTEKCHRHPHWMAGTYGVSAVVGLPPFMATTILAGLARMPVAVFLSTGFAGRFIRFSLLAASPALLHGWLM